MKLEIENKKKTSSFDINQLLLTYSLLTFNLFDAQRWTDLALPRGISLHRCSSEFLTRQSFDAGALTSPPLSLSQHLSRSKDFLMTLLEVPVRHDGRR